MPQGIKGSISKKVTKGGDRYVAQLPPSMGRMSKSFDTYSEAQDWLSSQTLTQVPTQPDRPSEGLSVGALLDLWLGSSLLKPSTGLDYRYRVSKWVAPVIGHQTELRPTDIDRLLLRMAANWNRVHIARLLSTFCNWAYQNEYLPSDPYRRSQAKRIVQVTRRGLPKRPQTENVWSVQQFIAFLEHEPIPVYRDLWAFFFATGARRGEALGLLWNNVDIQGGKCWLAENVTSAAGKVVSSDTPKNWKRRRAYFGSVIGRALAARKADQSARGLESPYVFDRLSFGSFRVTEGIHLIPSTVSARFALHSRQLGLPPIGGPHGLRRTFATLADQEGFRTRVIGEALGHSPSLTEGYSKIHQSELELLAKAIDSLLQP